MELRDYIQPALIAAIISGIVSSVLTFYFNKKLERHKRALNIQDKIIERRFEVHPKFVEIVYRIRNLIRDIISNFKATLNEVEDLKDQKNLLIDYLLSSRLDLNESTFNIIHKFKDNCVLFIQRMEDLRYYINNNQTQNEEEVKKDLIKIFNEINEGYKKISAMLSYPKITKKD